jgi:hypothetical protein
MFPGVRHGQAIHDLARLCRMRRVDGVPIADPDWLAYQETLWPHLEPVMAGQQASGGWAPVDQDRAGWFHTTPWILVFLGYLGINGTVSPAIERAVAWFVDHLAVDRPETYACRYAMFLRALLQLGFAERQGVRRICGSHLDWILERTSHCRGATRKGALQCACALVKELVVLNEYPPAWRDSRYQQAVVGHQEALLRGMNELSHCSSGCRQWGEYGYFRHVCPSWFEVAEALVGSGYRDLELGLILERIGSKCADGATWMCTHKAQRSVLLEGKRRTVSWRLNLEPAGKPSPWLSMCGLVITKTFERRESMRLGEEAT